MVLVVSANPAIDVRIEIEALEPGQVHRVLTQSAFPGGKGWHVATAVKDLGGEVLLTGFAAGPEGRWLAEQAERRSVPTDFFFIDGHTRRCLAVFERAGRVTEILEKGPEVHAHDLEALYRKISALLLKARILVLSGSLSPGTPADFYAELIRQAKACSVQALLDASGTWLKESLQAAPFAVKPNRDELQTIQEWLHQGMAHRPLTMQETLRRLEATGVQLPMVSLGPEGILFRWQEQSGRVTPPRLAALNAVGSGDCLMGGLAHGLSQQLDPLESLRRAVACAAANVLTQETGVFRREDYQRLLPQVRLDWPIPV